ncbi:hypothetical protein QFC22_003323 [Naganishia vaughanmartiniae]|uniref:Uncharacterized protein n=1 Tax=Naganishia vaughanmartiniae TaxID=1424756 RepID=A0ACC2X881_9TREE|nr:hypothetical protein QFC22_003323 [Naganishia vaughanmartiniae]
MYPYLYPQDRMALPPTRELRYIPMAGPQYHYARPEQIYAPSSSLNQYYATPASMSSDDASHHYSSSPMRRDGSDSSRRPASVLSFEQYGSRDEFHRSPSIPSRRNGSGIASTLSGTGLGTPDGHRAESLERVVAKSESTEDEPTEDSPNSPTGDLDDTQSSSSVKRGRKANLLKIGPPRPPNAWILYRSEKLKAIAAGERMKSLDEVLAEQASNKAEEASGSSRAPKGAAKGGARKTTPPRKGKAKQKGKKAEQANEVEEERSPLPDTTSREDLASKAIPQAEISKVISLMWKREKREEKAKYEKMAEMRTAEHSLKYPDYKFHPMKKEDKIRLKEEAQQERERVRKEKTLQKARDKKKPSKPKPVIESKETVNYATLKLEASSGRVQKKSRRTIGARTQGVPVTIPTTSEPSQIRPEMDAPPNQYFEQAHYSPHHPQIYPTPKYEVETPQFFQPHSFPQRSFLDPAVQFEQSQLPYGYSLPAAQPGFAVGNGDVVPYIFEPMPFGIISPPMASSSKSPMMMSSKEEPAVAMVAPAGFQPLGVSEGELEEMWSLLQDDALDQDTGNTDGEQTMLLGEAWSVDPDSALAGWNNFGMPLNEAPISVEQLSTQVGSRIANDWAGYNQQMPPPPPLPAMSDPVAQQGYSMAGPSNFAYAPAPFFQPPLQQTESHGAPRPRYMKIRVPPMDIQDGRIGAYEGPLLSSQDGLTPLGNGLFNNSRVSSSGSRSGAIQHSGGSGDGTPVHLIQERNLSVPNDYRIPTPLFGNQLSPPTYCDPPPSVLHSRQTSVSGEPFQWDTEDDRYGEPYRIPSFADVGRIPSNVSNISNERGGYAYPSQYRDFSANSISRRSVSAANAAPGE